MRTDDNNLRMRLKEALDNLWLRIKSYVDSKTSGSITQETDPTVPAWAKSPTKPTYTAQEVGALSASTVIPTKTSDLTNDSGFITQETDPTVPSWAKQANKPTYTAAEVGAVATSDVANNLTTTAPGKVLDARQGKALNDKIPTSTSDLTNDGDGNSPFLTAAQAGSPDMEQAINVLTPDHGGTGAFDEPVACLNLGAASAIRIHSYDVRDAADVKAALTDRLLDYDTSAIVKMDSAVWSLFTAGTRSGAFVGVISIFNDSANIFSVFGLEHNNVIVYGQVQIQGAGAVYPSLNVV